MSAGTATRPPLGVLLRLAWVVVLLGSLATILGLVLLEVLDVEPFGSGPRMRLLGAISVLPLFGTVGLVAAGVFARRQVPVFMAAAMIASAVAAAGWAIVIWQAFDEPVQSRAVSKGLASVSIVAVGLAAVGALLTGPDRRRRYVLLRRLLAGSIVLVSASGLLIMWSFVWQARSIVLVVVLLLGVVGILLGAGGHLGVRWIDRIRRPASETVGARTGLPLRCPRCDLVQVLPTGLVRCRRCGLHLVIEIEEPRCECGYLLFNLRGASCPECGRRITTEDTEDTEEGTEKETIL